MPRIIRVDNKYEERVWEILRRYRGTDNRISREELEIETGYSDRFNREIIHQLINKYKLPIVGMYSRVGGYFIAVNKYELWRNWIFLYKHSTVIMQRATIILNCKIEDEPPITESYLQDDFDF